MLVHVGWSRTTGLLAGRPTELAIEHHTRVFTTSQDIEQLVIGNPAVADVVVIWAKDVEDGRVKGFIVPTGTPS